MFARRTPTFYLSMIVNLLLLVAPAVGVSQQRVAFDAATKTFRLDGGNVSDVFGVNERGELQPIYWGSRLQPDDAFPAAHSDLTLTSFEASTSETQQEFAGWGQGEQFEPAL